VSNAPFLEATADIFLGDVFRSPKLADVLQKDALGLSFLPSESTLIDSIRSS
jgi:hypothetical protein